VKITDGWGESATVDAAASDRIGPDPGSLEGYIRPDGEPAAIDSFECDADDVERHPAFFDDEDVVWGDVERDGDPALALRIGATDYEYGDTARIRLTNVADRTVDTGNSAKYNLQAYTESGWRDVRVGDEDGFFGYTDEAIVHYPGGGFEWSIELTESGIAAAASHDRLEVCPDLAPGRYRFVYWGRSAARSPSGSISNKKRTWGVTDGPSVDTSDQSSAGAAESPAETPVPGPTSMSSSSSFSSGTTPSTQPRTS